MERKHSEGTQLLAQIKTEYRAAMRGISGLAAAAKHESIPARMENVGKLHSNVHAVMGDEPIRLISQC